jgi:protein CpxP
MTRRLMAAAAFVAALGTIPMLAFGQGRGRGPGGPGGPGPAGPGGPGGPNLIAMVHQLDLTDAQREQLRQIMDENRPADDPGAAVRVAERKLHAAILADPPDAAALDVAKSALNTAHAAELDHRIALLQKVAAILTSVQRQQLLELRPQGRGGAR